jgi:hypothetical protein
MTTTTANLDSFKISDEVHTLAETLGPVDLPLFRALAASIAQFCDASEKMIRHARQIEQEALKVITNVHSNLGAHGVESIGRYAADLAAATAVRSSSAQTINLLIDALADGSHHACGEFRAAARLAIFGTPAY